jgi:flagellar biosynthesis protein FlhF
MADALRQVKAVLGDDAVILETADEAGGICVTAASDEEMPTAEGELNVEVRRLIGAVQTLVDEQPSAPDSVTDLRTLHRALAAQGVDPVIAAALVRSAAARLDGAVSLEAAVGGLLPRDSTRGHAGVRLFIGAPGDGKTTTIVKLAAHARQAGRPVRLAGADTWRVGATAELKVYGRALDVPVECVRTPDELSRLVAGADADELILVDTAGVAPGAVDELAELHALVHAAGPAARRTLVVSAATGSAAAAQVEQAFAPLAPDACVVTKLDGAPGGPVLGVMWRHGVPVSHLATGRRIPGDIEVATPDRLARCLLAA